MVLLRDETAFDATAGSELLSRAFGDDIGPKPSDTVRAGRMPAEGLALVAEAEDGRLAGCVRLWHVAAGGVPALLLGPLAVDPAFQGAGVGSMLMRRALNRAGAAGHRAVVLVGDPAYYGRFGFSSALTERLVLREDVLRHRFLGLELIPGALAAASGRVVGTGAVAPDAVPTGTITVDERLLTA